MQLLHLIAKHKKPKFMEVEEVKFRRHLEEGYGIITNQRYNQWLAFNQLTESNDHTFNLSDSDSSTDLCLTPDQSSLGGTSAAAATCNE